MSLKAEVKTEKPQRWKYETNEMNGICEIADEKMTIKFVFDTFGNEFYDVLKIDALIHEKLKTPCSVEGIVDEISKLLPGLNVSASGRSATHGWITSQTNVKNAVKAKLVDVQGSAAEPKIGRAPESETLSIDKDKFADLMADKYHTHIVSTVNEFLLKASVPTDTAKPDSPRSVRQSPQRKIMDKITPLTMERERLEKELAEINSEVRGILFATSIYESDEIKDQAGTEDADSHAAGQCANKHVEADLRDELDAEIIDLTDWYVGANGNLHGESLFGDPDGSGEGVTTTRMVSRDGNVVTTRSGSRYRLSELAHPHIETGAWIDEFGDRWQLIDNHIKSNRKKLAKLGIQKG